VNGAENGAERADSRVSGSGSVSAHALNRERSMELEAAEREWSEERV